MKKTLEEKILQELIDKVIQKDRDIQNRHEDEAIKNATKEVLLEMTQLSSEEINIIEKEIRQKFQKKPDKKIIIWSILIFFAIITLILIFSNSDKKGYKDVLVFTEEFNDNANGWELIDNIIYNKFYKDGSFFFITNTDAEDKCFVEKMNLNLPAKFTAEITTTWHGGDKAPYGVVITTLAYTSSDSYYLHADHKAYCDFEYKRSDPWIKFPVSTENGEHTNIQKFIGKRGYDFDYMPTGLIEYFVNDHHIEDASTHYPFDANLSIKVCGSQSISFDHIKVRDNRTGKIVINSSFEQLKHKFEERFEFNALGTIENGHYNFRTDEKGQCYHSEIPYQIKEYSKIKLKSTWVEGEEYYYGFVLENTDKSFYAFELKSNGKACFIKRVNGENEFFTDNIDTGFTGDGNNSIEQTAVLEGGNIQYFINNKLIFEHESDRLSITRIGLRVCGRQHVNFDKLEIWE